MGQKNSKGSVSVFQDTKRIRLRWRYQQKRYSLNLFYFSKANLLQAKKIALQIEQDMLNGSFDASLQCYKPVAVQEAVIPASKTLVEHFEDWVKNYRNMDCERDVDYNSTRNMMKRWGQFTTATFLKHFNGESFGPRTYNRRLTLLKAFFQWAVKAKVVIENPLEDVLPKKVRKTEKATRKPFTEEEIASILSAFKNDTFCTCSNHKHSHYYPFVYFIFATGVRNAEAVGLRVQHIDFAACNRCSFRTNADVLCGPWVNFMQVVTISTNKPTTSAISKSDGKASKRNGPF